MAAKIICLLALAAVVVKSQESNNICDCESDEKHKEKTLLWDLLNKFATKLDRDGITDEERDVYATLPGMVSPLLRCECSENNRKKRKIFPETAEESAPVETVNYELVEPAQDKSVQLNDRRCPVGYARYGIYCIDMAQLELYDI